MPYREYKLRESGDGGDQGFSDGEDHVFLQVLQWLKQRNGIDKQKEDFGYVNNGWRYSPRAIRSLISCLSVGTGEEVQPGVLRTYEVPDRNIFLQSVSLYGQLFGFIQEADIERISRGLPLIGPIIDTPDQIWCQQDLSVFGNKIVGSVSAAARAVDAIRMINPRAVKVLYTGKFNGFPHAEHIEFIAHTLGDIQEKYGIDQKDIVPILAMDGNRNIEMAGSIPFLTSAWRLSLMSYVPWLKLLFPSGEFHLHEANEYWESKYRLIKPDFVPVEIGDSLAEVKATRATRVGAIVVERNRPDAERLSSTGFVTGGQSLDGLIQAYKRLLDNHEFIRYPWVGELWGQE